MQKNKFLLLIRSYNESSRIVSVIESIFADGFSEVLVVDDGSVDGTMGLLKKEFWEKIYFIRHSVNRGAWAALETGFAYIRRNSKEKGWKYVVTFDADGQHDISDMKNFFEILEKHPNTDVIYGSRFITKTKTNVPFFRRIILFWGKIFTSLISGVHLTDAHNGYRLLKVEVIDQVYLTMDGMEYASELIEEIHLAGYKIREVPVNIHYDEYTLAKWQRFGGVFRIVVRMLYKKIFR